MTITYRDQLTRDLTPAEVDANFRHALDSANTTFLQSDTGAISRTVQSKERDIISAKDWATGDGTTDDTTALANAMTAAAGKSLFFPDGTYLTTAALAHNTATGWTIKIYGGPGAKLKLTGTTNKGFSITGTEGSTRGFVTIDGIQIESATSGASAAAIHLDGVADYQIHDIVISPAAKFTNGIQLTGTQQGEISGGYISASVGVKFEDGALATSSNGCDMHGVSLNCSSKNIEFNGVDTAFIHGNHLTGDGFGIDVVSGGSGVIDITSNHIEMTGAGSTGLRAASTTNQLFVAGNTFSMPSGDTDLTINGGTGHSFIGNLFLRLITLAAAADQIVFAFNLLPSGTFTNNSTNIRIYGNVGNVINAKGDTQVDGTTIGQGTKIVKHMSASRTDPGLGSIAANTTTTFTITVTGAGTQGSDMAFACPDGDIGAAFVWSARVSALDTVTVRVANVTTGAATPTGQSWRADVWRH